MLPHGSQVVCKGSRINIEPGDHSQNDSKPQLSLLQALPEWSQIPPSARRTSMREFAWEFSGTRSDHMSGSAEPSQGFFSRRSFFRISRSLAAGLGLAPLISSARGLSSVVTSPAEKDGEDYYA